MSNTGQTSTQPLRSGETETPEGVIDIAGVYAGIHRSDDVRLAPEDVLQESFLRIDGLFAPEPRATHPNAPGIRSELDATGDRIRPLRGFPGQGRGRLRNSAVTERRSRSRTEEPKNTLPHLHFHRTDIIMAPASGAQVHVEEKRRSTASSL